MDKFFLHPNKFKIFHDRYYHIKNKEIIHKSIRKRNQIVKEKIVIKI
jgi:hypothetical protein